MDWTEYPELLGKIRNRRLRVLFVCVGNASRSQMAEAFANAYGPDVIDGKSAGLLPARSVASITRLVMDEKEISLRDARPKGLAHFDLERIDVIVNMSGHSLPSFQTPVLRWAVRDPNGKDEAVHRHVRDRVESQVIELVTSLREVRMRGYAEPRTMAATA